MEELQEQSNLIQQVHSVLMSVDRLASLDGRFEKSLK